VVVEFIKEIKDTHRKKVSEQVLDDVKAGYIGRFVMQVENPSPLLAMR
jgi:hypothetical protein